jgi:transcriptional regulator with XRE-family HTH domain
MAENQKTPLGPVGEALRHNVKRLREMKKLTFVELSAKLTEVGRPIPVLGLRRIERGERRVDVDDLAALAVVLAAPPVDLLVPPRAGEDDPYGLTPEVETTAATARGWIAGVELLAKPASAADIAAAAQAMPDDRAEAHARAWATPGKVEAWKALLENVARRQSAGTNQEKDG